MFTDRSNNIRQNKRNRQPWPENKPFKILSLDGGGIRGLFAACLLNKMQKNLGQGQHISKYFDLISGTSTGGIIAIGLGLQIDTQEIEKLYRIEGRDIFQSFWIRHPLLKFMKSIFKSVHNYDVLEASLRKTFKDACLGDSESRLVIPAFLSPSAEIAVLKTDHHPDIENDWKTPAWKVARATSAAPTFLGGIKADNKFFLDGGIWANNPIMCAIVEAISSYDIKLEQIRVLSIGTGNFAPAVSKRALRGGLVSWAKIINTSMFLTTNNAQGQAGLLLGPENILRIEPSENNVKIELDDWLSAILALPADADKFFASNQEELSVFFETRVDDREYHYSE